VFKRLTALGVTAALFATACGGSSEESVAADGDAPAAAAAESSGPEFLTRTVASVGGSSNDLTEYTDRDLILWFWAPW